MTEEGILIARAGRHHGCDIGGTHMAMEDGCYGCDTAGTFMAMEDGHHGWNRSRA